MLKKYLQKKPEPTELKAPEAILISKTQPVEDLEARSKALFAKSKKLRNEVIHSWDGVTRSQLLSLEVNLAYFLKNDGQDIEEHMQALSTFLEQIEKSYSYSPPRRSVK